MTILSRLTTVTDLKSAMQIGVVCLTDTNDSNEIRYAYVTTNANLIEYFGGDSDEFYEQEQEHEEHITFAYNILENEFIEIHALIFTGYAHDIASINMPDIMPESELLKLNYRKFKDAKGKDAQLVAVLNKDDEFNLSFSVEDANGNQKIVEVNEIGVDYWRKPQVFNNDVKPVQERDGYLLISKKHNPVFINEDEKDSVNLTGKSKLLRAIGFVGQGEALKAITLLANPV
jgi:hypothetical protein